MTFGKYPVEEMDTKLYVPLGGHNLGQSDFPLYLTLQENLPKDPKLVVIDPKDSLAKKRHVSVDSVPDKMGPCLALMHVIIKRDLYDRDFVEKWTVGFDKLVTPCGALYARLAEKSPGSGPQY